MTAARGIARGSKRLAEITVVFARHGFGEWFRDCAPEPVRHHLAGPAHPVSEPPAPERLRRALTELGPTFVKLGQMLSLMPGVLPAAYVEELATLQERVEPEPTVAARQTIERELGRTVDELFVAFADEPFAAGSLAQVYRPDSPTAPRSP